MTNIIRLDDRAMITLEGSECKNFLQGLITNDVNKLGENTLLYSAMLNSQGRFLYDFFIFEDSSKLLLDCAKSKRSELIEKLKFYKLRSKVEIQENNEFEILYSQFYPKAEPQFSKTNLIFLDPRSKDLGYRIYARSGHDIKTSNEKTLYDYNRIKLSIVDGQYDLAYEKSFILEFGFDDLNAIDYDKGCYIGQELTARTHHTGQIRKKVIYSISNEKPSSNSGEDDRNNKILSYVFMDGKYHILSLIRIS